MMKIILKKAGLLALGLLQGLFGSYFAILGWAFAFPESSPGSKDYEEDLFFVPLGFVMLFAWIIIMIAAIALLRKNKAYLALFLISWLIGLSVFFIFTFMILK